MRAATIHSYRVPAEGSARNRTLRTVARVQTRPGGLAPMEALVGTLIAFATAPDSVAADGAGKNGVYTENSLRNLAEPGLKVEEVFKRTRFAVRQETGGRRVPWENTSLEGDFYFVSPPCRHRSVIWASAARAHLHQPGRVNNRRHFAARSCGTLPTTRPTRSPSGFSFSREEEKDRATRFAKDDEIRARPEGPLLPNRCRTTTDRDRHRRGIARRRTGFD